MKTINFDCNQILPSLLNKSKIRTTRKAYKEIIDHVGLFDEIYKRVNYVEKPAKYEINEIVELRWTGEMDFFNKQIRYQDSNFNKKLKYVSLGKVKIIDIQKIKLGYYGPDSFVIFDIDYLNFDFEDFFKEEGFSDLKEMVKFFQSYANFKEPKEFWTYKWEWIK